MTLLLIAVLGALTACMTTGTSNGSYFAGNGYQTTTTATVTAEVVINGVVLSAAQEDELEVLIGERLPPGRYYVTQDGMMGIEGQPANVNLVAVIEARRGNSGGGNGGQHAKRGSIHNSSGDSHITSDGNGCTILSTPSGSLSSGC